MESSSDEEDSCAALAAAGTAEDVHDEEAAAVERMLKQWSKRAKMRRVMAVVASLEETQGGCRIEQDAESQDILSLLHCTTV